MAPIIIRVLLEDPCPLGLPADPACTGQGGRRYQHPANLPWYPRPACLEDKYRG